MTDRTVRAARIRAGFTNQTAAAERASELTGRQISQKQWSRWESLEDILQAKGWTLLVICTTCRCHLDDLTPAVCTFPRITQ